MEDELSKALEEARKRLRVGQIEEIIISTCKHLILLCKQDKGIIKIGDKVIDLSNEVAIRRDINLLTYLETLL